MNATVIHHKTITEDEFNNRFTLVPNPFARAGSWFRQAKACLFDPFGDDLAYVCRHQKRQIWSFVHDRGELRVKSGVHGHNLIGYLVTAEPLAEGEELEFVS